MYHVVNIKTGEVIATHDSLHLAREQVSRINRSTGKRLVRIVEAKELK